MTSFPSTTDLGCLMEHDYLGPNYFDYITHTPHPGFFLVGVGVFRPGPAQGGSRVIPPGAGDPKIKLKKILLKTGAKVNLLPAFGRTLGA